MEDQVALRRLLREAAAGVDALNAWVEHTLAKAEDAEAIGDEMLSSEMRACATSVWSVLNGAPSALIAAELHESMQPSHGALLDPLPA